MGVIPQRNEYKQEIVELKARQSKKLVKEEPYAKPRLGSVEALDLDEVGNKLEKARVEYQQKLKEVCVPISLVVSPTLTCNFVNSSWTMHETMRRRWR